ncbi:MULTISPECIES: 4Fe-4S binding protein [unclassified Methanosarcina]|uniref:4Fe-4S binding protein n=1 Tax=unclassified Methanosarcina TaxID=2644672 RepID=UPI000615818E|nr:MULTISPECIES: 4Fe-4S binding protein [unclassified Methanosarcina]AKB18301.1 Sulfite reductase-related protein [Methanosarcina sp. WWM596]AKB21620.1 Sulfite reductase-related protein [Methanosarcina sp. WH1]
MTEKKIDFSSLKSKGFLPQRQENMFSMRLKVVSGNLDAEKLRAIADAAEKYGNGYVHVTSRQQIEIPFVKLEDAEEASYELEKLDISGGSSGKKVRAVVACQGNTVCRNGLIDCQNLACRIDEKYFGEAVPKKLKIAVTGCPAACMRPQENDFGVMGTVKPEILEENCVGCKRCEKACKVGAIKVLEEKAHIDTEKCILCGACIEACRKDALRAEKTGCTIFVGGKAGRQPRHGTKLLELADEEQLFSILEKTFEYYRREGLDGERFGELLERLGIEKYRKEVLPS